MKDADDLLKKEKWESSLNTNLLLLVSCAFRPSYTAEVVYK